MRVSATNTIGFGLASAVNTDGARIRSIPVQMAAPTAGASTTDVQIEVDWSPLAGNASGNSPILSYNLFWDDGTGTTSLQLVDLL